MANLKTTTVWGLNEKGEVVATHGTGSNNIVGSISENVVPVDEHGRLVIAGLGGGNGGDASQVNFTQAGEGAVPRKVQDELRERVSVTQFGAKGDGVTDDVAAIVAVPRTRRVRLPAGMFMVSNTDFGATDLDLEGEGEGKTILLWKAGSPESSLFRFSGTAKVRFSHLTIDSNRQNQTDSAGYYAAVQHNGTNGAGLILDHVEFRNGRIEDVMVIGPTGAGESMRLEITNCQFSDGLVGTATRAAQAVAVSEGVNVTFNNNRLIQPVQPAEYGRGGLVMQRPAGSTSLAWGRLTATGNYFQNFGRGTLNALGCIYVYSGAETAIISGNTAKNVRGSAFCVKGDCGNAIISDNLVDGHASTNYAAISLFDMADSYTSYIGRNRRISGNVIRNSEHSGIYVDGNINGVSAKVANVNVTDNIIDGGVRGVHLRAVDTSKVSGNTITNTTGVAVLLEAATGICDVLDNTIQAGVVGLTTTGDVSGLSLTMRGNSIKGLAGGNAIKLAGSVASFDFRNNKIDGCVGAFEIVGCSGNGYIIGNTTLNTSSYVLSKAGAYGNLTYRDNVTSTALGFTGARMVPIASGAVTIFADWHYIDTEASAATDDLDTINGGYEGRTLTLVAANGARDVVLKDGTGNLRLAGDFTLNNAEDSITLHYRGSAWHELSRSDNGA